MGLSFASKLARSGLHEEIAVMRIVLVNPQWMHKEYFGKFDEARSVQQPLGIAYLAAFLEKSDHEVKLIDAAALQYDKNAIIRETMTFSPALVGISATTASFTKALAVAKEIKKRGPRVALGGPHVTALPEQSFREDCFDIGVIGEGELTLLELVAKLESEQDLRDVKGIIYKKGSSINRNPARPYIVDLDSIPFPARHLLPPLQAYRPTPSAHRRLPQATMITSRGCPYNCTFCDHSVFGSTHRVRSPTNVVDEMELLVGRHAAKEIRFWDDTFNIHSGRVLRICDEIRARGIDVPWTCLARMDHMNDEMLLAMADAGCWQIDYGIESGNQELLNNIRKGLTLEVIRKVAKMTHEAGIGMRGFFMLGLPGESEDTMRQTIKFAKELELSAAVFHVTTPFPGTELHETAQERGELDSSIGWDNYSLFSSEASPYVPNGLTRETIMAYQAKANKEFYMRLGFILRQALGIRSLSDVRRYVTGFAVVRNLR
jgi:radical SAM superfamily enzyme YgiQ (UPF0313 family)